MKECEQTAEGLSIQDEWMRSELRSKMRAGVKWVSTRGPAARVSLWVCVVCARSGEVSPAWGTESVGSHSPLSTSLLVGLAQLHLLCAFFKLKHIHYQKKGMVPEGTEVKWWLTSSSFLIFEIEQNAMCKPQYKVHLFWDEKNDISCTLD